MMRINDCEGVEFHLLQFIPINEYNGEETKLTSDLFVCVVRCYNNIERYTYPPRSNNHSFVWDTCLKKSHGNGFVFLSFYVSQNLCLNVFIQVLINTGCVLTLSTLLGLCIVFLVFHLRFQHEVSWCFFLLPVFKCFCFSLCLVLVYVSALCFPCLSPVYGCLPHRGVSNYLHPPCVIRPMCSLCPLLYPCLCACSFSTCPPFFFLVSQYSEFSFLSMDDLVLFLEF